MGCGASINATSDTRNNKLIGENTLSNPKLFTYRMKKLTQLACFLESLGLSKEVRDECEKVLIKDCQGFTISEDGEEAIVIEELIHKIISLNLSPHNILKAGTDLIKDLRMAVEDDDKKFGRCNDGSAKYLLSEIAELDIEPVSYTHLTLPTNREV
eukprot:TRINITY_DN25455_c0_g1_i1.p1 TRINITY_DN25455_c0_g1~~TRINITY_DN25455_c0_g1_i1.p1  ORF type:complete len:156 (+),score=35.27 TRINITY_DN25455_c0_g1_i1:133-600(+)